MLTLLTKVYLWILKKYIRFTLRNKTIFVFSGLRRSGNHVCINWFANAVLQKPTVLDKADYMVFQSTCKKLLHLNEVNIVSPLNYVSYLRKHRDKISAAHTIFISLEDLVPNDTHCIYFPKGSDVIYITRSVLSTMASRLAYNIKRAKMGIDRGDMNIDQNTFNLVSLIRTKQHVWDLEKWLTDEQWRTDFLARFKLSKDITPGMSSQGGGSTFHGQNQLDATSMTNEQRWSCVEWPERMRALITTNRELLSTEETQFIANW
ncbi:hypothetical protein [Salinimonas chungwhensis]|uniref:hypothetical protein n=1 Tax=Salinimonas chungwhensis TaxID=265425 RepID=UPI0003759BEC|nr:hypothetical protein [Salinimonas chungwhensis]